MNQRYPTVFATVDVVFIRDGRILLGRKPHQEKFRFIGGFADPALDRSYEDAAIRESREETGLEVSTVVYSGSARIDDPRYRGTPDAIITHLFVAESWTGEEKPSDDIAELRWFDLDTLDEHVFVPEHDVLFHLLREKVLKHEKKT